MGAYKPQRHVTVRIKWQAKRSDRPCFLTTQGVACAVRCHLLLHCVDRPMYESMDDSQLMEGQP